MATQFWHNDITEQSYAFLIKMRKRFSFVLIGGWAVYLYTQKMKSKDIDIIVDFEELGRLRENYDLVKNDRLKKYEINLGEFDVDIYTPFYSKLGIPLEKITANTMELGGFRVPRIEYLLALKARAYEERKHSAKGEKDKIDIISMLDSVEIDWGVVKDIQKGINVKITDTILDILKSTHNVRELDINNQGMAKLKKSAKNKLK